jgi:hypothetical protein
MIPLESLEGAIWTLPGSCPIELTGKKAISLVPMEPLESLNSGFMEANIHQPANNLNHVGSPLDSHDFRAIFPHVDNI